MACHTTITRTRQFTPPGNATANSAPTRIGDRHRTQTQNLLGQALAMGYLSFDELESRLDLVAAAATSADLTAVLADLPVAELRANDPARKVARTASAQRGLRIHTAAYTAGILLTGLIWLTVAMSTGAWFPWPLWPLVGGGIGVIAHAAVVRRTA